MECARVKNLSKSCRVSFADKLKIDAFLWVIEEELRKKNVFKSLDLFTHSLVLQPTLNSVISSKYPIAPEIFKLRSITPSRLVNFSNFVCSLTEEVDESSRKIKNIQLMNEDRDLLRIFDSESWLKSRERISYSLYDFGSVI